MEDYEQHLLSSSNDGHNPTYFQEKDTVNSLDYDEISPINGFSDFLREFYIELKKVWYLAGPSIFTSVCQYGLGAFTQIFAGQIGTIQLAAVSVENSVIAGFGYGMLVRTHILAIRP